MSIEFPNVTATAKANIYFDGKVISHTIHLQDGSKKTLGLIFPGTFYFGTAKAEIMQVIDGECKVVLDSTASTPKEMKEAAVVYNAGQEFRVPANSGFHITVETGVAQYICSFVDE